MGFAEAVRRAFRNYIRFQGRAGRPEFWYFVLFVFLGSMVAGAVDGALFGVRGDGRLGPLGALFSLGTVLPLLSAAWRRMHDTGRSGLYALYPLIVAVGVGMFMNVLAGTEALLSGEAFEAVMGIGGLVLMAALFVLAISPLIVIWWLTRPGEKGVNRWGPPPA